MKIKSFVVVAAFVVLTAFAVWNVAAAEKPFEGPYMMMGETADLLAGEKIVVEEFISPTCPNCYLLWKNRQPPAADVELKTYYVYQADHAVLPTRLLLVARDLGAETEEKTLAMLFDAAFVQKVNIEDEEIIDALAGALGIADAWQSKKNSTELKKKMDELLAYLTEQGVERTPRIVIQKALVLTPRSSGVTAENLPKAIKETIDGLRAYRQANKK
ncbi:MAG TPA: hypothetical protein PKW95_11300 [bacterium]|nr:hypothetical protein [bacterium]